jgi:hypothetical protein
MSLFEIKSFDIHQTSLFSKNEGSERLGKLHPDLRNEYNELKQKKNKGELHPAGHIKLGHYDKYLSGNFSHDDLAKKVVSKEKPEPSQRSKELTIERKRKEISGMTSGPDVVVKDERIQPGLRFDVKPQSTTMKKLSDPSKSPTHTPTGMPIIDLRGDKPKSTKIDLPSSTEEKAKPDTPYLKKLKKTSDLKVEHQKEVSRLAKRPEHMKTPREELTEQAYAKYSTGNLSVSELKTKLVELKSSTLRGKGEKKKANLRQLRDPAWTKAKKENLTPKQKIDKKYDSELAQLPPSMKERHTQMSEQNKVEHRGLFHKDETTGLNDKEETRLKHIHNHIRGEIDHNELDKRLGREKSKLRTWFKKDKRQKDSGGRIISHGKYVPPKGSKEEYGYKIKKYHKVLKALGFSKSSLESQKAEHDHIPHISNGYKLHNVNNENTGVMHFGEGVSHGPINMVIPKGDHYIFHSQNERHDKDTKAKYLNKVQKHFKLSSPEAANKLAKDVIGKYNEFGRSFKDKVANNPQGITVNVLKHKDSKVGNGTILSHYWKPDILQGELPLQKGFKQTGLSPDEENKYNERWDHLSDKHKNHYLTLTDKNNKSLVLKPNYKDLPEGESKFKSTLKGEHKEHFEHYHNYLSGKTTHDELMNKLSPSQSSLFDKVDKELPKTKGKLLKPLGRVKSEGVKDKVQMRMFKSMFNKTVEKKEMPVINISGSESGMFNQPKSPIKIPSGEMTSSSEKPMVESKGKKFDKDISVDNGKYKYEGNQKEFEKALYDYGSHSNFVKNAKPEHQGLRDKIKTLHPADDNLRNSFNKTTGRWQDIKDRPGHLIPGERTTLTKHQNTSNYWGSKFLSEDEKKDIDRHGGGKKLQEAAEKGDLSSDLLKKLKDWSSNHYNVGRERVLHKEGKFIKGQGEDKSPLENWYHHPTGSNKELETDISDTDDSIQESMFNEAQQGWKKGGTGEKSSPPIASLKTGERMEGEEVEYAGQKHKILNKVTENGKTKAYNITGEDGITRKVNKEALEHEKRKKSESEAGQIHGEDIHSKSFYNSLRGRKKDIYDVPFGDELPKEMKEQLVNKHGFSTDEAVKIHQHINSPNIKQGKGGKNKEFMQSQNVNMSENEKYQEEMLKKVADYHEGEKEQSDSAKISAMEEEQAGKRKSEYEKIINKHKDHLEGHFHPNKNEIYAENKKEHHKLHTINQAGLDHYMQKQKSADKEFNEKDFLNGIGIEANPWTLNEAKKVMKESKRLKYRESGQNLRAKIKETYQKSVAHSIDYIKGKLKKMGKRKEEPKPTLKGLAPYKLWELQRSLRDEAEDYMRLVLNLVTTEPFELYNQLMLKKSVQYALATTQEYLNMDEVGYEEYQKSIPQSLYTLHDDGTFSERIINPFE